MSNIEKKLMIKVYYFTVHFGNHVHIAWLSIMSHNQSRKSSIVALATVVRHVLLRFF